MKLGHWDKPVTYEEDDRGGYRTIRNTEEAARALLLRWPVDEGVEYFEAREFSWLCWKATCPPRKPAKRSFVRL